MVYTLILTRPLHIETHGAELKKFTNVQIPDEVRMIVANVSLLPFIEFSLNMFDAPLLFAFVER